MGSCAIRRGPLHEVETGQTLWRISQVYDVKLDTLLKVNDIEDPTAVKPGTRIIIPGAGELRDVPASPQQAARKDPSGGGSTTADAETSSPPEPSSSSGGATDREGSGESDGPPASSSASGEEPPGGSYFDPVRPCDGRLASRFDKDKGPSHRGIRIHTSEGNLVKAAEEGNIKLAGSWDQMPELGKIVIIFHSHDFTTVYAHLKSLNVSEGETVERDEPIGTVGRTGNVDRPVCYFEVRYKLEPRDPLIFLGEST